MPRIGLILPGEAREAVLAVAEEYTITVIRNDGYACTDVEASTVMTMFQLAKLNERKPKRRRAKQPEKA